MCPSKRKFAEGSASAVRSWLAGVTNAVWLLPRMFTMVAVAATARPGIATAPRTSPTTTHPERDMRRKRYIARRYGSGGWRATAQRTGAAA
jgi:hypothetical protein